MSSSITRKFPKDIVLMMEEVKNKLHPWRLCSKGYQYRGGTTQKIESTHPLIPSVKLPPSVWKCIRSSSTKDVLHPEEILIISAVYFPYLSGAPRFDSLDFPNGNDFDSLIRGWVCYWNDVFEPEVDLDANLVKALIASESGFSLDPPGNRSARGLMQITEKTRKALGDIKGELKNRFIVTNKKDILDASNNICAGTRWLFHKRKLASLKLNRLATWEEAVAEYKSYAKEYKRDPDYRGMGVFRRCYKRLSK